MLDFLVLVFFLVAAFFMTFVEMTLLLILFGISGSKSYGKSEK